MPGVDVLGVLNGDIIFRHNLTHKRKGDINEFYANLMIR
ncbi:hypothetical protein KL86DYS2_13148 [uncultured Dysgonomonas sp.]|uniref:Uncharacterized protein n=1 Tax=uncultured Dysgonomonas sp. TaxID=206096 RepID=A0A212K6J3_9BACT|nr:hypothetical protein KL86DYS2_13148 [uncultured Dysgonomonas sp.]DAI67624.1 MAG TPA: hypothetical protein [Caudoviricetes sp.]